MPMMCETKREELSGSMVIAIKTNGKLSHVRIKTVMDEFKEIGVLHINELISEVKQMEAWMNKNAND